MSDWDGRDDRADLHTAALWWSVGIAVALTVWVLAGVGAVACWRALP